MKKLIIAVSLLISIAVFGFTTPAWAGDAVNGQSIFTANCAACHMGGRNVVNPVKTLQKEALEQFKMNDIDKIIAQVTNGKGAMPSFRSKLNAQEIEDVATYVLAQAEKGW